MPFLETAMRKWVEGKARRYLAEQFAALGKENLLWLVDRNRSIVDFYTPEQFAQLQPYAAMFRDADLMTWLSPETQEVLRSHPKGEAWVKDQMRLLKERLGV